MNTTQFEMVPGSNALKFHVVEAFNLPGVDSSGTSDPYVVLTLTYEKETPLSAKSATIKKNCNPKWNETLSIKGPCLFGFRGLGKLKVEVYDANVLSKDVI
jgi:Ca2+-dependent lipid-binding protein